MTRRVARVRPSGERARVAIPGPAPRNGLDAPSRPRSRAPSVWMTRPVATSETTTFDHPATAARRFLSAEKATASASSGRAIRPRPSPLAAIPGEQAVAPGERVDPILAGCHAQGLDHRSVAIARALDLPARRHVEQPDDGGVAAQADRQGGAVGREGPCAGEAPLPRDDHPEPLDQPDSGASGMTIAWSRFPVAMPQSSTRLSGLSSTILATASVLPSGERVRPQIGAFGPAFSVRRVSLPVAISVTWTFRSLPAQMQRAAVRREGLCGRKFVQEWVPPRLLTGRDGRESEPGAHRFHVEVIPGERLQVGRECDHAERTVGDRPDLRSRALAGSRVSPRPDVTSQTVTAMSTATPASEPPSARRPGGSRASGPRLVHALAGGRLPEADGAALGGRDAAAVARQRRHTDRAGRGAVRGHLAAGAGGPGPALVRRLPIPPRRRSASDEASQLSARGEVPQAARSCPCWRSRATCRREGRPRRRVRRRAAGGWCPGEPSRLPEAVDPRRGGRPHRECAAAAGPPPGGPPAEVAAATDSSPPARNSSTSRCTFRMGIASFLMRFIVRKRGTSVVWRPAGSGSPGTAGHRSRPGCWNSRQPARGGGPVCWGHLSAVTSAACRSPWIARCPAGPFRRDQERI